MSSIKVGNVEILSLLDLVFAFPYSAAFPSVPPDKWEPYKQLYPRSWDKQGNWATNAQAFLLRTASGAILVDTGMGPGPHEMLGGATGNLLGDMQSKGVRPGEVGTVIFTHLHFDHCGWSVRDGRPVFPNARYLAPEADWTTFSRDLQANPHIASQVEPLQRLGIMELVAGEKTVSPEVVIVPTPGHTPGHQSVVVASAGERAFILGDVFNHPAQVNETEWNAGFDGDPSTAAATRKRVMERLEADGSAVAAGHYPAPGIGRIVREGGRRLFREL